jgi:GT2 family glycosyltransferase
VTATDFAVVVLNWNNAEDTLECLTSLRQSTSPLDVIVVDNGSTDGSAETIDASGLADTLIRTGANLGYSGGNNIGLRHAIDRGNDFVCVLNNDTLAEPETFANLREHLKDRPADIAVSPTIHYADDQDKIWFAGGTVDRGWPRHLQPPELPISEASLKGSELLTGCCIVARREVWERVGLFDDRYFLIFEDSDWSMRARKAGIDLMISRDGRLLHKVSRSFRDTAPNLLGTFYFTRNGMRFEWDHFRRFLPRFINQWVLRPTLRDLLHRKPLQAHLFAFFGAASFLVSQSGTAPLLVQWTARLAKRRADALARQGDS